MAGLLTLFGDTIEISKKKKVSWSNSKIGILETCPRKYYYGYYGSKRSTALSDPNKEELSFLSKLSNKYLFPGTVVHDVIRLYFKKFKKGDEWEQKKLMWLAEVKVRDAIKYSIEKRSGVSNDYEYEPSLLQEVFFDKMPESELGDLMMSNIGKCLRNFGNLREFEHLIMGGKKENSIVEEFANFDISNDVTVTGKIDLAFYTNDQKFIVADWKTGKNDEDETSLQLLVYALWAVKQNHVKVEDVVIQKAFLNTGELENLRFSELELEKAKIRIIQSAEVIQELDKYGETGNSEAFTPVMQEKVCALCPFKTVCHRNKS